MLTRLSLGSETFSNIAKKALQVLHYLLGKKILVLRLKLGKLKVQLCARSLARSLARFLCALTCALWYALCMRALVSWLYARFRYTKSKKKIRSLKSFFFTLPWPPWSKNNFKNNFFLSNKMFEQTRETNDFRTQWIFELSFPSLVCLHKICFPECWLRFFGERRKNRNLG